MGEAVAGPGFEALLVGVDGGSGRTSAGLTKAVVRSDKPPVFVQAVASASGRTMVARNRAEITGGEDKAPAARQSSMFLIRGYI